jgi:hypothetical protein
MRYFARLAILMVSHANFVLDQEYSVPQIPILVRQIDAILERKIRVEDWERL